MFYRQRRVLLLSIVGAATSLFSMACDSVSPLQPGEVVSASGTLSMILPDTIHTLGLYVDVTVRGWRATDTSSHCFHATRSPSYSLDGAPPLDPTAVQSCNVLQSSDSSWTLFVSQNLAPGRHTLAVSANGSSIFKAFQVVRDTSRYSLVPLPTLGGASSGADINQDGVVVGWARDVTGTPHAVTWTGAVLQRLPDADSSRAIGLNDRGAVVGVMQDPRLARRCLRGVLWVNNAEPQLLRAYPGAQPPDTGVVCLNGSVLCTGYVPCPAEAQIPVDINDKGTILVRGYLDAGGTVTTVQGGLPFQWSLNNHDQAIISLGDGLSIGYHDSLLGLNVTVKPDYIFAGACARSYTSVAQISDRSVAVGNVRFCDTRAFSVDSAGKATDLSSITGDLRAIALNNLGDVLLAYNGNFILKAGRLLSIAVTEPEPGWTNVQVTKINDAGVILGSATDASGVTRAVLLNPVR